MARGTNKLTAAGVRAVKTPGLHSDGGGLYLVVDKAGAKRWSFLFRWEGKRRELGLGGFLAVPLATARQLAKEAREAVAAGVDPIEARRAARAVPTFGEVADDLVKALASGFRNEKHKAQWAMTLTTYAAPLRPVRVDKIEAADVLATLKPLWQSRPETASRLRGRIERVLDAAKAKGFRAGDNPARWKGHLDHLLPKRQKLTRGHHAALPFADVPAFVARLHDRDATAALALEFTILTTARSNEVIGARWSEIDLAAKVWTVPAARMKAGREHRVPLCARAVAILEKAQERRTGAYVFPGPGKGRPLSTNAVRALLLRLGVTVTGHGFRSSFRDWAGEASTFPRELAQAALAHTVGDATERAYRRGDALDKRRKLMDAWAAFVAHGSGKTNVTPLRGVA